MKLIAYEPNPEVICNHAARDAHRLERSRSARLHRSDVDRRRRPRSGQLAHCDLGEARYALREVRLLQGATRHSSNGARTSTRSLRTRLPCARASSRRPRCTSARRAPDMSTDAFCVTCHQSAKPTSLSPSALTAGVAPMQARSTPPADAASAIHQRQRPGARHVWPNDLPASATPAPRNTYPRPMDLSLIREVAYRLVPTSRHLLSFLMSFEPRKVL